MREERATFSPNLSNTHLPAMAPPKLQMSMSRMRVSHQHSWNVRDTPHTTPSQTNTQKTNRTKHGHTTHKHTRKKQTTQNETKNKNKQNRNTSEQCNRQRQKKKYDRAIAKEMKEQPGSWHTLFSTRAPALRPE